MLRKKTRAIDRGDIKAFLGSGCQFEGTLNFEEIVRLDGIFTGKITSKDALIIGPDAHINADIDVGHLVLSGKFKGDIRASLKVELRVPAQVEGNIYTPSISIEEGVQINGSIRMSEPDKPSSEKPPEKKKAGKVS